MTKSDGQDIESAIQEILAENARRKEAEARARGEAAAPSEQPAAEPARTETASSADALGEEVLAEVAALKAERDELKDRFIRALAEAENARKRSERDRKEAQQYGGSKLARDLLPVYDALHRALGVVTDEMRGESGPLIEGVELTLRELKNVFAKHGVVTIEPEPGTKFDPQIHEAMFEAAVPGTRAGEIIQVMGVGFTLHDRLLRPAQVGVSSTPAS